MHYFAFIFLCGMEYSTASLGYFNVIACRVVLWFDLVVFFDSYSIVQYELYIENNIMI
jgi:hypothetical protein